MALYSSIKWRKPLCIHSNKLLLVYVVQSWISFDNASRCVCKNTCFLLMFSIKLLYFYSPCATTVVTQFCDDLPSTPDRRVLKPMVIFRCQKSGAYLNQGGTIAPCLCVWPPLYIWNTGVFRGHAALPFEPLTFFADPVWHAKWSNEFTKKLISSPRSLSLAPFVKS